MSFLRQPEAVPHRSLETPGDTITLDVENEGRRPDLSQPRANLAWALLVRPVGAQSMHPRSPAEDIAVIRHRYETCEAAPI